jgi:hypothetical protein
VGEAGTKQSLSVPGSAQRAAKLLLSPEERASKQRKRKEAAVKAVFGCIMGCEFAKAQQLLSARGSAAASVLLGGASSASLPPDQRSAPLFAVAERAFFFRLLRVVQKFIEEERGEREADANRRQQLQTAKYAAQNASTSKLSSAPTLERDQENSTPPVPPGPAPDGGAVLRDATNVLGGTDQRSAFARTAGSDGSAGTRPGSKSSALHSGTSAAGRSGGRDPDSNAGDDVQEGVWCYTDCYVGVQFPCSRI